MTDSRRHEFLGDEPSVRYYAGDMPGPDPVPPPGPDPVPPPQPESVPPPKPKPIPPPGPKPTPPPRPAPLPPPKPKPLPGRKPKSGQTKGSASVPQMRKTAIEVHSGGSHFL
jgi:hypothetical protein